MYFRKYTIIIIFLTCLMACAGKNMETTKSEPVFGTIYFTPEELVDLKKLADKGDGDAAYNLALYCQFIEQNEEKGFLWLKKSAEYGKASSMRELAKYYLHRKKDKINALRWFKIAAEKGDQQAKEYLYIWVRPEEFKKVSAKAKSGNADEAFRLYDYYSLIEPNDEKKIYWIKKAAENGHAEAQFIYANAYCRGKERLAWLKKSAANGNVKAKEELEKMQNLGTPYWF